MAGGSVLMSALSVPSRPLPAPGASLSLPSWSRPIPSLSVCGSGPMSGSSGQLSIGTAALCPPHPQLSCCLSDTPALSPCTLMHRGIARVHPSAPCLSVPPTPSSAPVLCTLRHCGAAPHLPVLLAALPVPSSLHTLCSPVHAGTAPIPPSVPSPIPAFCPVCFHAPWHSATSFHLSPQPLSVCPAPSRCPTHCPAPAWWWP